VCVCVCVCRQMSLRTARGKLHGQLSFIDLAGSEKGSDVAENEKKARQRGEGERERERGGGREGGWVVGWVGGLAATWPRTRGMRGGERERERGNGKRQTGMCVCVLYRSIVRERDFAAFTYE
jgi:hypothetical protein